MKRTEPIRKIQAGSHATTSLLNGNSSFSSQATGFVNSAPFDNTKPKAYLNWILFDEQFNMVASASNHDQVKASNASTVYPHVFNGLPITKNGYLYIYVSNQTANQDVFFDNLQVTLNHGPILEETHYYPFGLTMAGISTKAMNFGQPENKRKYNGIEFDNDLDLNSYETFFRDLDVQTGRWWQIDPTTDGYENLSPYASMYNDPIMKSDPKGDEGEDCCWNEIKGAVDAVLISASGVVNGALNTFSGGLISTDPFKFRRKLSGDQLSLYDGSVQIGQIAPLVTSGVSLLSETPALQPVNGSPISVPVTLKPVLVPISNTGEANGSNKKNSSNEKLIEDAKEQKIKEQKAQERQQNKQQATQQGKQRQGKSNQNARGEHDNTKGGGGKAKRGDHENANARRAREQKAADEKKKGS